MRAPDEGNSWLGVTEQQLPIAGAYEWCVQPNCGAVVLFSGTVRDHAVDEHGAVRSGVTHLTYEAYDEQVVAVFHDIERELRERWPHTGRLVLLHRTGRIELGESSVVAVVSAPHRGEAFAAGQYAIDALKASAPIWKHEEWDGGADWGTGAQHLVSAAAVPSAADASPASRAPE